MSIFLSSVKSVHEVEAFHVDSYRRWFDSADDVLTEPESI